MKYLTFLLHDTSRLPKETGMAHETALIEDSYWLENHKSIKEYYEILQKELKYKREDGASQEELDDCCNRYFMPLFSDYARYIPEYNKLSDEEKKMKYLV